MNMYYINYPIVTQLENFQQQVTFEDLFRTPATTLITYSPEHKLRFFTKPYETLEALPPDAKQMHINRAGVFIRDFSEILRSYSTHNMAQFYTTFQIPKHSGGMRTIKAPDNTVKADMQSMLAFFQGFLYPNQAAYAYVKQRSIKDAMEAHQKQEHEWFLHMDLRDFFGSSNPSFIKEYLCKTPFFSFLPETVLNHFIHFITLDNGLPQGTPLSPFITNMLMIEFDFLTHNEVCRHNGFYTRYADDLIISTTSKNATGHMQDIVRNKLSPMPYRINVEKTRVSSIYGKNWNLGLMLNKDHQITVGYKNKERFRATINEFCKNPQNWSSQMAMELLGKYQYFFSIESEYFTNLLTKYGQKFNMDVRQAIITRIKAGE